MKAKKSGFLKWIVLLVIFAVAMIFIFNRDKVYDYYRGLVYKPSAMMAQIRTDLNLTAKGEFLFNSAQPVLSEREEFNENCRASGNEIAILGCYTNLNIYVYNIEDKQLDGIRELTAAHELLHVVYAKMNTDERMAMKQDLEQVYKENREFLEDELDIYVGTERYEELYVRAGTEVKNLPQNLEEHYAKIFRNQDKVVDFYDKYIAVFRRLEAELKALEVELDNLDAEINNKTNEYERRVAEYSVRVNEFNNCADTAGCFITEVSFNASRIELLNERAEIESLYDELTDLVAKYNELVQKYNNYILETEHLNNKINSNIKPKEIE